jgi:hypothetical protein
MVSRQTIPSLVHSSPMIRMAFRDKKDIVWGGEKGQFKLVCYDLKKSSHGITRKLTYTTRSESTSPRRSPSIRAE